MRVLRVPIIEVLHRQNVAKRTLGKSNRQEVEEKTASDEVRVYWQASLLKLLFQTLIRCAAVDRM